MRPVWFALPLLLALTACDDPDRTGDSTTPSTEPAPPSETAEVREGLAGIWQPQDDSELTALVLGDDSQLYLVGDQNHRGVRWEKQEDGTVTFFYLDSRDGQTLHEEPLSPALDNPSLTLTGDSPLAGEYQRDTANIGTLEGRILLPDDATVPDVSVLVLALHDQTRPQSEPVAQHLTRLMAEDDDIAFQLYFSEKDIEASHRYTLSAQVILDGAVQFSTTTPYRVLDDADDSLSLALHTTSTSAPLANTYWKLIQVEGEPTPPPQEQNTQAHLVFHSEEQKVKGSTGCNNLSGDYQQEDGGLQLERLATTERACPDTDHASAFRSALAEIRKFEIQGQRLTLYYRNDEVLAILQAEYLF